MECESRVGRPPALMLNRTGYGTLAAARCLGRAGVPVTLTGAPSLTPLRWSRFITRSATRPPRPDLDRQLRWLLDFGREQPGHVLLPEDDTWLWWMASHREELSEHFAHALPAPNAVYRLLDKKLLGEDAGEVGIATPRTWCPESDSEMAALDIGSHFPVVVKPRTHIGLNDWKKGQIAHDAGELDRAYGEMRRRARYVPQVAAEHPAIRCPLVQQYHPLTERGVYNITGFVDRSGELFVAQAMWKLLQAPRRLGIGVAFESAPLDPALRDGLRALFQRVGFHGIFEAEFLPVEGRMPLIDLNPRYFHGMGFAIARGAPLPLLAYLDAVGDTGGLAGAVAAMPAAEPTLDMAFCFGRRLSIILRAQRLTGGLTDAEARHWRTWRRDHHGRLGDAIVDRDDPWPGRVDPLADAWTLLRHPRGFAGTYLFHR